MAHQHSPDTLNAQYTELWRAFANALQNHTKSVAREVATWASGSIADRATGQEGDGKLHELLWHACWTPKHFLQVGMWEGVDQRAKGRHPHVGSATGVFFEHLASTVIGGALRALVEGGDFHRNCLPSGHAYPSNAPRQPDLLICHGSGGATRSVVFEFKAAPNPQTIGGVVGQRDTWEESGRVRFYFVGGLVGVGAVERLRRAASDAPEAPWATGIRGRSERSEEARQGLPTIDALVADAAVFLKSPR